MVFVHHHSAVNPAQVFCCFQISRYFKKKAEKQRLLEEKENNNYGTSNKDKWIQRQDIEIKKLKNKINKAGQYIILEILTNKIYVTDGFGKIFIFKIKKILNKNLIYEYENELVEATWKGRCRLPFYILINYAKNIKNKKKFFRNFTIYKIHQKTKSLREFYPLPININENNYITFCTKGVTKGGFSLITHFINSLNLERELKRFNFNGKEIFTLEEIEDIYITHYLKVCLKDLNKFGRRVWNSVKVDYLENLQNEITITEYNKDILKEIIRTYENIQTKPTLEFVEFLLDFKSFTEFKIKFKKLTGSDRGYYGIDFINNQPGLNSNYSYLID
jgi:hypothetical protein